MVAYNRLYLQAQGSIALICLWGTVHIWHTDIYRQAKHSYVKSNRKNKKSFNTFRYREFTLYPHRTV